MIKSLVKKLILFILPLMAFSLCACTENKKNDDKIYDIKAGDLASKLAEELKFEDEIEEASKKTLISNYELDESDLKDMCAYFSTVATTEEIGVFLATDFEKAQNIEEKCNARIKNQMDLYASYAPKEVKRLENAFVKRMGNVVILCINNDRDSVENIVNEYFDNIE